MNGDQELASVGAVIENIASTISVTCDLLDRAGYSAYAQNTRAFAKSVRDTDPDATAALNEMLADAWDAGYMATGLDGSYENPHRKETT